MQLSDKGLECGLVFGWNLGVFTEANGVVDGDVSRGWTGILRPWHLSSADQVELV
uniref:Uncharacterized protein n=1 Tax=Physcomitrium patens TaxID=3218 RepID=A0A7I4A4S9_PHYPA